MRLPLARIVAGEKSHEQQRTTPTASRGTALCVVPALAAALLLVVGLSTADLTLVYVSIAVSVVVLPAFVYGVVLVVRALASGQDKRAR